MPPKLICLTPVLNEAWILDRFLKCASIWADHIIISDQGSTDGSVEIAKQYKKVIFIDNNKTGDFNEMQMRAPLFEAANSYDSTYFYMLLGIYIYLLIFLLGPHMIIGIVFFGVSFKKRNPLKYGIEDIEQELPPVDKTLVVQVNNQNSRQPDKFDEIIKYKTLLDQGIITQEEFEEKKRELL